MFFSVLGGVSIAANLVLTRLILNYWGVLAGCAVWMGVPVKLHRAYLERTGGH
ncbi:MAG: hypothetical protein ACK4UX_09975 [Thiobacillus sp.]